MTLILLIPPSGYILTLWNYSEHEARVCVQWTAHLMCVTRACSANLVKRCCWCGPSLD